MGVHKSTAKAIALLLVAFCCHSLTGQEMKVRNLYRREGNGFRWRVYIDEDASKLQRIRCVEYTLYPSFPTPIRDVCDAKGHFALEETGRGEFTMILKVEWRDREPTVQSYALDLHSNNAPRNSREARLNRVEPSALAILKSGTLIIADEGMGRILSQSQAGFMSIGNISTYSPIYVAPMHLVGGDVIAVASNKNNEVHPGRVWVFPSSGGIGFWNSPFSHLLV